MGESLFTQRDADLELEMGLVGGEVCLGAVWGMWGQGGETDRVRVGGQNTGVLLAQLTLYNSTGDRSLWMCSRG